MRQDIWQPVPGRLLGVGGRFIVADRKVSPGAEGGARRLIPLAGLLIPLALLLILEATGPGPPSERAGKVVLDRRRGRSDCGDVHQASEDPAAQTVTMVPISAAIPSLPVPLTIDAPDLRKLKLGCRSTGPVWRDQLLSDRLYTI